MKIHDVIEYKNKVFEDERGCFTEIYRDNITECRHIIQENLSYSNKFAIRGLHYQTGIHSQGKLVQVIQGSLYDMVVDLRASSPTFGESVIIKLTINNSLWVPRGCAHGIFVLEDNTTFLYRCDNYYNKKSETGLRWNDPRFGFRNVIGDRVLINERDKRWATFEECIKYD